jgi:glycosyltransferase involved in cell wall biosynthesis
LIIYERTGLAIERKNLDSPPGLQRRADIAETIQGIPQDLRSRIILVDDCSTDKTLEVAKSLELTTFRHTRNLGYGANQKTCYRLALSKGAEIVVMLHPDNQYDPRVVGIMSDLIFLGNADMVLGNRIRNRKDALSGGMPLWKYVINRFSTLIENLILGQTIGDFHSGLRAYSRGLLETIPFENNSDSFGFDQELLVQASAFGFRIGEVPVPTIYTGKSSSINIVNSLFYGYRASIAISKFIIFKLRLTQPKMFKAKLSTISRSK